jgi:hypothetical protein
MTERANRYDVLAKELCSCKHCGARYPDIDITSVEYKEKGRFRKIEKFYRIKGKCTSRTHYSSEPNRDFTIEVPYNQYWSALVN